MFLFGFAKSERENITPGQLADLKAAAGDILSRSEEGLADDIAEGRLQEVDYGQEN